MKYKAAFQTRTIILSALAGWVNRGLSIILQLATINILLGDLTKEEYAAFVLVTSANSWFQIIDLGFGTSLQNYITKTNSDSDRDWKSTTVVQILILGFVLICILFLFLLTPLIADIVFVKIPTGAVSNKSTLLLTAFSLACISGGCSIVLKVFQGQHKGYIANLIPCISSTLSLIGMFSVKWSQFENKLLLYTLIFQAPTAIVLSVVFYKQIVSEKWRLINHSDFLSRIKLLSPNAISAFLFALLSLLTLQVDYFIASQTLNANEIYSYSIISKVFAVPQVVFNAVLFAVWPTLTDAAFKADWVLFKSKVKSVINFGVVLVVGFSCLLPVVSTKIKQILNVDGEINFTPNLIIVVAVYQIVRIWTDTFAMALQSLGIYRPFWFLVPFQASVSILLQWKMSEILGVLGLYVGLIIGFLLTVSWGLPFWLKNHINNQRKYVKA